MLRWNKALQMRSDGIRPLSVFCYCWCDLIGPTHISFSGTEKMKIALSFPQVQTAQVQRIPEYLGKHRFELFVWLPDTFWPFWSITIMCSGIQNVREFQKSILRTHLLHILPKVLLRSEYVHVTLIYPKKSDWKKSKQLSCYTKIFHWELS